MELSKQAFTRDNKIYAITVAYGPAALIARGLIEYQKNRIINPNRHVVVLGHYPINRKKNNHDIELICDSLSIEILDPGSDLGSAQSQNWALSQLPIEDGDYFLNIDPDSNCRKSFWDTGMKIVLDGDPNCALISCWSPLIERNSKLKDTQFEIKTINAIKYCIPTQPTPFNLSMWRYSFIKDIGGIPQLGLMWGETEGAFWQHCIARNKYHAYLSDFMEDETAKHMQDVHHAKYKDDTLRVPLEHQFRGTFSEYLQLKFPEIYNLDTCRDLTDFNFP